MAAMNSRFAVAIHILAVLEVYKHKHTTSDFLAGSVGTNPVVVRRITKMLADAGLIYVHAGVGGAELARSLEDIPLLDVYRAVEAVDEGLLFAIHPRPDPSCLVGGVIQVCLEDVFSEAREAMERVLAGRTMRDVAHDIARRHTSRA